MVLRFDSLRNVSLNQQTNPYFEIVKKQAKFRVSLEKQKTLVPHPDEGSFEKILVEPAGIEPASIHASEKALHV